MGGKERETEIGGPKQDFPSTLWTVVLKARDAAAPDRCQALERLIQAYWKPLYHFIRRKGNDPEASKDIAQGFFAALLEKNFLQYVERDRGKFRTFLLTALEHYMADEYDRSRARKRGGGRTPLSLDFGDAETDAPLEPAGTDTPERVFRRDWALRVMSQAMEILRSEFERARRLPEFDALRLHLAARGPDAPSYAESAKAIGVTEAEARNRIHRVRSRYREAILEVIRSYTHGENEAREELGDLFAAFAP